MTEYLTPTQYATKIRMSRTHLHKLIERGELAVLVIDGITYVNPAGMPAFEARRDAERKELAERFHNADALREKAIEEIAARL